MVRSPLKAERRQNGCLGRSRVAQRTFRHRHGRHGRREIFSVFKTVAQRSPRRSVAHRSLEGGRMKAHTSPWSHNGCTVVGHWSPSKKCEHCVSIWATRLPSLYHHCASFGRPMASIEGSLWRPLCLHSATTATLEPPRQWFCLHSAFFVRHAVPLQQLWSFKEGTRVVLQQLHRNRTFWVPATTERPNHFYGRTKVARRLQPCVKGALLIGHLDIWIAWIPNQPKPQTHKICNHHRRLTMLLLNTVYITLTKSLIESFALCTLPQADSSNGSFIQCCQMLYQSALFHLHQSPVNSLTTDKYRGMRWHAITSSWCNSIVCPAVSAGVIHYRQKYGIFENHKINNRIWQF